MGHVYNYMHYMSDSHACMTKNYTCLVLSSLYSPISLPVRSHEQVVHLIHTLYPPAPLTHKPPPPSPVPTQLFRAGTGFGAARAEAG